LLHCYVHNVSICVYLVQQTHAHLHLIKLFVELMRRNELKSVVTAKESEII